jgi:hypothetical protein
MSENCILCLEDIDPSENPLVCGHKLHLECVKKHFKPECPICRRRLNISVNGTIPELYLPFDPESFSNDDNIPENNDIILENIYNYIIFQNQLLDLHELQEQDMDMDMDLDIDEENPRGDEWNYEDV